MPNETYYSSEEKSIELTMVLRKRPVWWLRWGTIALFVFLVCIIVCFCRLTVNSKVIIPVQSFVIEHSADSGGKASILDITVQHRLKNYFSFYPDQKATVINSCSGQSVTGKILSVGHGTGLNRPDTIYVSVSPAEVVLAGWRLSDQYTISLSGKIKLYRKIFTN